MLYLLMALVSSKYVYSQSIAGTRPALLIGDLWSHSLNIMYSVF